MDKKIIISKSVEFSASELAHRLAEYVREKVGLDHDEFLVVEGTSINLVNGVPTGNLTRPHEKSSEYAVYVSYPDNGKPTKKQKEALELIGLLNTIK